MAPKRLGKVATELNVGAQSVVEFLTSKGHTDISINSKLTEEQYNQLLAEYQSDKTVKELAEKLSDQNKLKRESADEPETPVVEKETKKQPEPEELIIKNVPPVIPPAVSTPTPPPEPAPSAEPTPEVTKEKPADDGVIKAVAGEDSKVKFSIKGKIDLDKLSGKGKASKKAVEPEAPKEEPVVSETPKEEPIIEEPVAAKQEPEPEKAAPEEKTPEVQEEKAPEVVSTKDSSTKDITSSDISKDKDIDFHRTEVKKLEGPTIIGRMELPVKDDKKKPAGSSSPDSLDKNKKKKRKRIKKSGEGETVTPVNTSGTGFVPRTSSNYLGNKPRDGRKPDTKPGGGPTEISHDDIQKQIKETLARISGGGKSKASKHRRQKRDAFSQQMQDDLEKQEELSKTIKVTEFVSANELARMMNVAVNEIISTCMSLGIFVSINQRLDAETLSIVAEEFGFTVEFVSAEVQEAIKEVEDAVEDLLPRPPIVTVMGHVDHGKTSLLDYIRKANVIAGEAGGITQHIGAYSVSLESGKRITFLDTPGHEAFTAMRARGAQVTDVAIIVVAADDNVMPQTKEAINHAQAAGVPIVFAINKIDKPNANPDKVKEELANLNCLVEEWGGKYQSQEISAKFGKNIETLLEKVLLEAEILDLKANAKKNATGTIIESSLDKGRGYVSTMLVSAGTLKVGDIVLAGCYSGRVKALFNERNMPIEEAGPSMPVLMLGLSGAPQAGDRFNVMDDEREARDIATKRLQLQREQGYRTQKHITLDEIGRRLAIGDFKELNIIVKGDVDGSIEALSDSLIKLSTEKIQINIIHKSVGQVTESDVLLASASNAIIVGFQVRPSLNARKLAEQEQIDVRLYSIIYDAINEIKLAMEGMLAPEFEEKVVSNIEVRDVFHITKVGTIAGCMVLDGKITRQTKVRVIRDGIVIHTGELDSLKRFKDDVKEVAFGYECGLNIKNFNDLKVGDIIEGYTMVEVKKKL